MALIGSDSYTITKIKDGINADTYYFYVRYSAYSDGRDMTSSPDSSTLYMGVSSSTSTTAPSLPTDYKWSLIKGSDGKKGDKGESSYLHVKYSNDGKTFTSNKGEDLGKYIGTYVDEVETDSEEFNRYDWIKIVGEDGNGISGVTEKYLASTKPSGVKIKGYDWKDNISDVSFTSTNKYLWNYEIISYSNKEPTETEPKIIGVYGDTGENGRGIKDIINYYLATSSTEVSRDDKNWSTISKDPTAQEKYLWNYEEIQFSDNSEPIKTEPHIIATYVEDGVGYTVYLTNENHSFIADSDGNIANEITTTTTVKALKNGKEITATIGDLPSVNGLTLTKSGNIITVKANKGSSLQSNGDFNVLVTVENNPFVLTFSYSKVNIGAKGDAASSYDLTPSAEILRVKSKIEYINDKKQVSYSVEPSSITFSATKITGDSTPVAFYGKIIVSKSSDGKTYEDVATGNNVYIVNYTPEISSLDEISFIRARLYNSSNVLLDTVTVPFIFDSALKTQLEVDYYTKKETAGAVTSTMRTVTMDDSGKTIYETISEASQTSKEFSWLVGDGYSQSNIVLSKDAYKVISENINFTATNMNFKVSNDFKLSAGNIDFTTGTYSINANNIDLTGKVTFKDLNSNLANSFIHKEDGTTVINGGNIDTDSLFAKTITVPDNGKMIAPYLTSSDDSMSINLKRKFIYMNNYNYSGDCRYLYELFINEQNGFGITAKRKDNWNIYNNLSISNDGISIDTNEENFNKVPGEMWLSANRLWLSTNENSKDSCTVLISRCYSYFYDKSDVMFFEINNDDGFISCDKSYFDKVYLGTSLLTTGKTSAYDGTSGFCLDTSLVRHYFIGNSTNSAGLVFGYNNATSFTSSLLENTSGNLCVRSKMTISSGNKTGGSDGITGITLNGISGRIGVGSNSSENTAGVLFFYNNSTSYTSSLTETSSGVLEVSGKLRATNFYVGSGTTHTISATSSNNENITNINSSLTISGSLRPSSDSTSTTTGYNLGTSARKWRNVYAYNGTIQTSDKNEKHNIIYDLDNKLEILYDSLKPATYIMNHGERTHLGYIAQDIEDAIIKAGYTTDEIALLCKDQKTIEKLNEDGTIDITYLYDEDGNPEYLYGLRYNEFIMLNTWQIQKIKNKLLDYEQRILELENLIKNN